MQKKQHNILTKKNNTENFFPLWKKIAQQIIFKLYFNDTYNKNINETVILKNNLNEHVIYDNYKLKIKIVMYCPREFTNIFHKIYVVNDSMQSNRYFIGFIIDSVLYCPSYSIMGFFVYFNSNGMALVKILDKILCDFFPEDSIIDEKLTFLYNQTLIFFQEHKDTSMIKIHLNLFSYDDTLLYQASNDIDIYSFNLSKNINNKYIRFIYIKQTDNMCTLLDLGSLKFDKMKKYYIYEHDILTINSYNFDEKNIEDNISLLMASSEEEYSDGYPNNCIKCGKTTKNAIYINDIYTYGLGSSYCNTCEIRFSKTDNKWICCKITLDNNICSKHLDNNFYCLHDHSDVLKLVTSDIHNKSYKYPFKEHINVTIK